MVSLYHINWWWWLGDSAFMALFYPHYTDIHRGFHSHGGTPWSLDDWFPWENPSISGWYPLVICYIAIFRLGHRNSWFTHQKMVGLSSSLCKRWPGRVTVMGVPSDWFRKASMWSSRRSLVLVLSSPAASLPVRTQCDAYWVTKVAPVGGCW